ncbi:MAG: hypothetical protein DRP62_03605 [Planctomycetota bacterium]|nr:MAG: hypothetical protein DRP62_03605 [Planctomycetota bacterium]
MARKKLNKKVALIGSAVATLMAMAAILLFLYLSRDPEKFIQDGDAALKAAHEATDEQTREEEYKNAERAYSRARAYAKKDSLKVEMLFKLVDLYLEIDKWNNIRGCWGEIIRIDPDNVKARFGQLKFFYILADSGAYRFWQEVAEQASALLEVAEDAGILTEYTAKWDSFEIPEQGKSPRMGPYLYLLRGRANLEMASRGAVTDPDKSLALAVDDLEKVLELEPNNVDVYQYLAQAAIAKGEILASRGSLEERDKAAARAEELLEQAVELAGADESASINLLNMKLRIARSGAVALARKKIQALEPEYLSLVDKFPDSPRAFLALAEFYSDFRMPPENLDKAVDAAEKAIELDSKSATYAMKAAELYYRRFSIYGQKADIYKAIEIAKNALTLPDAQDKPGPRQWANRRIRIGLYDFLANCCIELVLEARDAGTEAEPENQKWLKDAELAVHEIEQLFGSGEEPQVIKWRGMLELAKGNKAVAIKKLYATYEQLKAAGTGDARLSYALAKIFQNTSEVGAAREFLASALNSGIVRTKPEALLDYVEILFKLRAWTPAISSINAFEENFGANERSRRLRIAAYIGAKQFDEAEEQLAGRDDDDPNTIVLNMALIRAKIEQVQRAIAQKRQKQSPAISSEQTSGELMTTELDGYWDDLTKLTIKLLAIEPNSIAETSVFNLCNHYIAEGKISKANDLVEQFFKYFPDNTKLLFYKQLLSEPEPDKVTLQRRREIEQQVISGIADPTRRAMALGAFYQRNNEPNKAAEEFKKVIGSRLAGDDGVNPAQVPDEKMTDLQHLAVSYLFDISLRTKDWELARKCVEIARRDNIDDCGGNFFAARLAIAGEEYKDALANLNECLKQRPVFSHAYILRSNVNAALGDESSSIQDAQKAASLNPLDGAIAKGLANALYRRNRKLGSNVSSDQIIEARAALDRAMLLNPGDLDLLNFYAEYISSTEPDRALAIRQSLQQNLPSMRNAMLLGRLAMKMALEEKDTKRKDALFDIAASSFEQARKIDPNSQVALDSYAEYYRARGQNEKAEQLLKESHDQRLLWRHYFKIGQFEQAGKVLERLHQSDAKDIDTVKGLLLVAEKTGDTEQVKKYSQELLSLEDSVDNNLIQIRAFLEVGLVKEAEYKLQSFRERYPDEPRAMLLEAWLVMRQGQLKKALELTNRNLETDQDNSSAWRLRGEINRLMANYDQAIIDLKKSRSLSDEPTTRIALAKAYLQAGRDEDAITELKNTIDNPQAPAESGLLLEQIYFRLGRKETLRKFYDEMIEKYPDNLLWYKQAGKFAISESDFGRAEQLYKQALRKSRKNGKGDAAALDGYLQSLVLSKKLDKVFEEAGKYVDGALAPIAYLRMAEAKLKMGDKETAVQYCRSAVDKAGADENLVSNILRGMYSLLGAEDVRKVCRERLEADPNSLSANSTMFNLAKLDGQYNKAIAYIDKCLQIVGPARQARIDYTIRKAIVLQLAYTKTSDNSYLQRAIEEYESLLAEMPNNSSILNNLAYMLVENNEKLSDALQYAKRSYELMPNNPNVLDTYGYALYKNGRFAEADEFLQAALQQYESRQVRAPAELYEHLGMTKEKLGAQAEALAAYKQALKTGMDKLSEAVNKRITSAVERLSQ